VLASRQARLVMSVLAGWWLAQVKCIGVKILKILTGILTQYYIPVKILLVVETLLVPVFISKFIN
jgi:hypothetical protein